MPGKQKWYMTYTEEFEQKGHEMRGKAKALHDLFGRICSDRSCDKPKENFESAKIESEHENAENTLI